MHKYEDWAKKCRCHPAKPTPDWAKPWLEPMPRAKVFTLKEITAEYEKIGHALDADPTNDTLRLQRDYIYDMYASLSVAAIW